MSEIYTLKINDRAEVFMMLRDFLALGEELRSFGVSIDIQQQSKPGLIIFKLKELSREQ